MASELKLSGTTARVILQGNDTITADQTFTFPDSGGELVVSDQGDVEVDNLVVGTNAQPSVTINKAYGVVVKPVSTANGGAGSDALWHGFANDGSTTTSKITASGGATFAEESLEIKNLTDSGTNRQYARLDIDGKNIGDIPAFTVYNSLDGTNKAVISTNGNATFSGYVIIGTSAIQLYNNGTIVSQGTYSTTAPSPRSLYVGNDGVFGGVSSVRASKKNIEYDYDSAWVLDLKPVAFNYRKQDKETQAYTAETYDESQYGLIAEDAETVNREICNYNGDELQGVEYMKLITPILSELQKALTRIEALEAEVQSLKGGQS